jgi:hypothetical protein
MVGTKPQPVVVGRSPGAGRIPEVVATALAVLVGLAALVYAWFEQYGVDPEVTLLPWIYSAHGTQERVWAGEMR